MAKKKTRSDSVLNTGLSSAASRRVEARRQKAKEKREAAKAKLTPDADIILEWIDKEKADIVNVEKMILAIDSEENVVAQILARKMHIEFLNKLKTKAKNILRELPGEKDA